MQDCPICGRSFDPLRFQVVVPELGRGFDRVECARSARALGGRAALPPAPLVAVVEPLGTSLARPLGIALRPLAAAPLAALGLFAAGTAAAAYLWVGVLSSDTSRFAVAHTPIAKALGQQTVRAAGQPAPSAPEPSRGQPDAAQRPTPQPAATISVTSSAPTVPAHADGASTHGARPSTVVARPVGSASEGSDATAGQGKGHAKHGRGHAKHGKGHAKHGKGHAKHGDRGGVHRAGHGQGHGHAAAHTSVGTRARGHRH